MENVILKNEGQREYLVELPDAAPFFNLSKRANEIFKNIGDYMVQQRLLVESDIATLAIYASKLDEYLQYDELIKIRNKQRKFSGSIQKFKTGADNVTALFVVRNKLFKELFILQKELLLTPRARAQAKQIFVNPNQFTFDFDDLRKALGS